MLTFSLPAEFVDCARLAASDDRLRYYLNGVFVDARGRVAATNGHILFAGTAPDAMQLAGYVLDGQTVPGIIIPKGAIDTVAKGKGSEYTVKQLDNAGTWTLGRGANITVFTPIDGTFPDYERVLPSGKSIEGTWAPTPAHYDPKYMAAMAKMAKILIGDAIRFEIAQDAIGPGAVMFGDVHDPYRTDCLAVIMPIRTAGWTYDRSAMLPLPREVASQAA
jgi:hypothetical protein